MIPEPERQLEIIGAIVAESVDAQTPLAFVHAVEKYAARQLQLERALEAVLNSAVDPSKAKFAMMVNLAPVREALKKP